MTSCFLVTALLTLPASVVTVAACGVCESGTLCGPDDYGWHECWKRENTQWGNEAIEIEDHYPSRCPVPDSIGAQVWGHLMENIPDYFWNPGDCPWYGDGVEDPDYCEGLYDEGIVAVWDFYSMTTFAPLSGSLGEYYDDFAWDCDCFGARWDVWILETYNKGPEGNFDYAEFTARYQTGQVGPGVAAIEISYCCEYVGEQHGLPGAIRLKGTDSTEETDDSALVSGR